MIIAVIGILINYFTIDMISEKYLQPFLNDYKVVLSYKGEITHDKITQILSNIKLLWSDNYVKSMRIYGVVNELLENVLYHGKSELNDIEVVIIKNLSSVRIITFNKILGEDKKIEQLLNKANQLNKSDLKKVKNRITNKLDTKPLDKNGFMGIGLELIRLKSKGKIMIGIEELVSDDILITDVEINS